MNRNTIPEPGGHHATFVRIGGLVALLTVATYLSSHLLLIAPPPASDAPIEELRAYVSAEADPLILANGLRNLILAGTLFFAVAAYLWTGRGTTFAGNPWGAVGLLGATALLAVGVVSNTLRTVAFLAVDGPAEAPGQFLTLLHLNSVLDRVLQLFSGLMIGGFSVAGLRSATMPRWLVVVGLLQAVSTVVTTVGIAWAMSGAQTASLLITARTFMGLAWFLTAGVLMMFRASK